MCVFYNERERERERGREREMERDRGNIHILHAVLGKEDSLFDNAMIVTSKEIEDIMHSVAL